MTRIHAPGGCLGHFPFKYSLVGSRPGTGQICASTIVYKRRSFARPMHALAVVERFFQSWQKKNAGRKALWKLPQLWKSTKEAFGNIFLMISTSCLEKPTQKTLRLFHRSHSAGGGFVSYLLKKSGASKHNISFTPDRTSNQNWTFPLRDRVKPRNQKGKRSNRSRRRMNTKAQPARIE